MKPKKILFVFALLVLCNLSFAQNIRVIGIIPEAGTGKTYQLQVGAFRYAANMNRAAENLVKEGFVPQYEKIGNLIRVFVAAGADDVRPFIARLGRAGFREVIIREYVTAPAEIPPAGMTVTEIPPVRMETAEIPEELPEEIPAEIPVEIPQIIMEAAEIPEELPLEIPAEIPDIPERAPGSGKEAADVLGTIPFMEAEEQEEVFKFLFKTE